MKLESLAVEAARALLRTGPRYEQALLDWLTGVAGCPIRARAALAVALLRGWVESAPERSEYRVGTAWWCRFGDAGEVSPDAELSLGERASMMGRAKADAQTGKRGE